MARFSKYNNPSKKKRRKRKLDYDERVHMVIKEKMIDDKLGYDIPISYYQDKYNIPR